jgi:hypothetical protein
MDFEGPESLNQHKIAQRQCFLQFMNCRISIIADIHLFG